MERGLCVHFVTPDRDVECDIQFDATAPGGGSGSVRCGIHRNRYRDDQGGCFFRFREKNWSRHWYIVGPVRNTTVGANAQRRCFSDVPVTVLRDGQKVGVGPFHCRYRAARVTCVNSLLDHGFSISNKTQRTF